jgi:hypothetical protein
MANLISRATGDFTAAGTWNLADTASFSNSEVSNASSAITFVSSAAFTPGAITIDGIGVKIISRSASPTGTFTVRLAQAGVAVAGTTVTINVSDLPTVMNGWAFFKFSGTVTLLAATAYTVQIQSSVVNQVTLYKTATSGDWSRFLRTTTTQAPAAADYLIVCGEYTGAGTSNSYTVTMDNTAATVWSGGLEISGKGTLSYGSTVSTNYQLRMGAAVFVNGAGTLQLGTLAAPIPGSSTAKLEFVVGSNVAFGLTGRGECTITTYGVAVIGRALIGTNASAAATTIVSTAVTGWLSGDSVAVASTTATVGQTELVTLSGNASGTSIPISALAFAHTTSPYQGELINLTRNVKIFGQSTSLQTFINASATGTFNFNYTELYFMGSNVTGARGIDIATTTGSFSATGCALHNFESTSSVGFNLTSSSNANITLTDCVGYRFQNSFIATAATAAASAITITVTNCWAFVTIGAAVLFAINTKAGTYNGLRAVSSAAGGSTITIADATSDFSFSNYVGHSNNSDGILLSSVIASDSTPTTFSNITVWSNGTRGLRMGGCYNLIIDTVSAFSNATANIELISTICNDIVLKNMTLFGGALTPSPSGVKFSVDCSNITVENSALGIVIGHSTGDIDCGTVKSYLDVAFRNCLFSSTTFAANTGNLVNDSFIGSSRHQQTAGSHFAWTRVGTMKNDTVIYDPSNPASVQSLRMQFANLTTQAIAKSPTHRAIVKSGKSLKLTLSIRQSVVGDGTAFIGNFPRVIMKKNPAIGLNSDVVLATATGAGSGAWEVLSGTTAAATDDGVIEFYVDVGSPITGWINVDNWKIEVV